MNLPFSPFPILETPRMILRQIVDEDVQEMFVLRSDKRVMQYIDRPMCATPEDALVLIRNIEERRVKQEGIAWGMCLRDNPRLIGTIGYWRMQIENFRAEIGYLLHPDFHRKGLTSEAMGPVMAFGFEKMNLHSIEAHINPGNQASAQLLEKHGFVREAYFRENYFFNGRFLDTAIYALLSSDLYGQ